MGNCLAFLFGRPKRPRSYFSGRYKDYNVGVEFDNLIEDENDDAEGRDVVNKTEKDLLMNRQFTKLVENQRLVDAEIDAELQQEEERTRLEEEAYIAAKKEAARIAKQAKRLEEQKKKKPVSNGSVKSWAGDGSEWSIANEEEDDFDSFLQSVTARSENVRASGIGGFIDTKAGIPGLSSSSTNQKPFPDGTSTDLFSSQKTDEEWEADFVSAEVESVPSLPGDSTISEDSSVLKPNGCVGQNSDKSLGAKSRSVFAGEYQPRTSTYNTSNFGDRGHQPSQTEPSDSSIVKPPVLAEDGSGSSSKLHNEPAAQESFSITDEGDDDILDIAPEDTEQLLKDSVTPVLDGGSKNTTKIEAEAFEIDIDKFLEELDAEL